MCNLESKCSDKGDIEKISNLVVKIYFKKFIYYMYLIRVYLIYYKILYKLYTILFHRKF